MSLKRQAICDTGYRCLQLAWGLVSGDRDPMWDDASGAGDGGE